VVLLPSLAMLLIAIWQRVEQYGITEKRYVMVALALWLTAVALFYGLTGSRDIRVIPLTLLLLAAGTFAGPFSVYSMSERSQLNRLHTLLSEHGMIHPDGARPAAADVPREDARQISAVLRYFEHTRGLSAAEPVLGADLVADATDGDASPQERYGPDSHAAAVAQRLGVVYVDRWESVDSRYLNVHVDNASSPLAISGYDYLLQGFYGSELTVAAGTDTVRVVPSTPQGSLDVFVNGDQIATLDLGPLLDFVTKHPEAITGNLRLEPEEFVVETRNGNGRARLVLDAMMLNQEDGAWKLMSSSGKVLIDLPERPDA